MLSNLSLMPAAYSFAGDPVNDECSQIVRVSAYHDGELSAEATRELEIHLRTCSACAAELEQFRTMTRRMASVELPRLSGSARRRIRRALEEERAAGRMRIVRAITGIAASLFLVAGAKVFHDRMTGHGPGVGGSDTKVVEWNPAELRAANHRPTVPWLGKKAVESKAFADFVVRDLEKGNE